MVSRGRAVLVLIVNLFLLGVGTYIGGRSKAGIYQFLLFLFSLVVAVGGFAVGIMGLFGIPLLSLFSGLNTISFILGLMIELVLILALVVVPASWIWALISSIQIIKEST